MTDYSQLVKTLRMMVSNPFVFRIEGIVLRDSADAIDALQARVAELEAGLRTAAYVAKKNSLTPQERNDSVAMALRALLERN